MNALIYLTWTSARNRFVTAFRRVQSPRYAAALIVGGVYIWSLLFRSPNRGAAASFLLGRPSEALITLLMVLTLAGSWVFGADVTALAFTQAEVSMLFAAPLSRLQLVGLKLFRAQIAVLINALIWVFVLRRGGPYLPSPLRAFGLWIMFSTLNLHRLGAALVQSAWRQHGRVGVRKNRWSIAIFAAIGVLILEGLVIGRDRLIHAGGIGEFFTNLGDILLSSPAAVGLWPFHLIVAPTFAKTIPDWERAILPAMLMLMLHSWWVLRTDAAFEDAAIEASAERARRIEAIRSRRAWGVPSKPRKASSTLRLSSAGHPAIAILWKNMLCLRRTVQLRLFIGPFAMALAFGAAVTSAGGDTPAFIATSAVTFAGILLVFGSRLIRNDLRHDMLHLPLLKALPVSSGDIVLAEVASSALPMAAVQITLVLIAYVSILMSSHSLFDPQMRDALLVSAPFAALSLNAALITIQNGMAVLFPAWMRLGTGVSTGVEALGQNVLGMVAHFFTLGIALLPPVLVGWISASALHQSRPVTITVATIVAAALLSSETYAAIRFLGRALGRVEPLQS
ncbi:MAG: putative ABC exporter domain-containing protein [Gemmatimonas sp.]